MIQSELAGLGTSKAKGLRTNEPRLILKMLCVSDFLKRTP